MLRFNLGAPDVILVENCAFSPNKKKEVLKENLIAYQVID